jgi:hypothetical protein
MRLEEQFAKAVKDAQALADAIAAKARYTTSEEGVSRAEHEALDDALRRRGLCRSKSSGRTRRGRRSKTCSAATSAATPIIEKEPA